MNNILRTFIKYFRIRYLQYFYFVFRKFIVAVISKHYISHASGNGVAQTNGTLFST